MSGNDFDPSLIIFAALAIFVVWKLRSVLGVRTEREDPAPGMYSPPRGPVRKAPTPLPGAAPANAAAPASSAERWKGVAEPGSSAAFGLDAIAAADPAFSGPAFVEGARKAYEMIIGAFAKGDRQTLVPLLSPDVLARFTDEIIAREQRGETVETLVVSFDSTMVVEARAEPRSNVIKVRFASKLINARRNRAGEVIDGNLGHATAIVDLWTFARDPKASDPNWRLVATETAA